MATDVARLAIEVQAKGAKVAKKELDGLSASSTRAQKSSKAYSQASEQMSKSSFLASNGLRQTSMQLSQVAQQTSATGNFIQSLAIQLPDLALALGPVGILLGAAAGGLLSYASAAWSAEENSETLADTIDQLSGRLTEAKDGTRLLSEEMRELAKISKDAARIELIVDAQKARSSAITAANAVIDTFESVAGDNPLLPDTIYSDRLGEISDTLNITREDAQALADALPRTADRSQEAYQDLLGVVAQLADKYGSSSRQVLELAEALNKSGVQAIRAIRTEEDLQEALAETDKLLERSKTGADGKTTAYEELYDAGQQVKQQIDALNASLEFQVQTYGDSERAIALAKIEQLAKNGADAEAIRQAKILTNQLYDRIEAEEAAKEAEKSRLELEKMMSRDLAQLDPAGAEFNRYADQIDRIEEYNISAAEKERLREEAFWQHQQKMQQIAETGNQNYADYAQVRERLDMQILSSATQMAGNIAGAIGSMVGEQSDAYRVAFLAQQGFALATSIINTQMAAVAALAPPPIGLGPVAGAPYAAAIEALGAANIGVIAGQTLTGLAGTFEGSYLGGGYTGSGSRTGGIDGKGGFPAILHPDETVIDHKMGGSTTNSSNVNQTIVMNVSGDVTARTRQEILKAMPMIRQQARQSVLQATQEGGAMSRAVGRRS
jgi:hypothetical protein